jgi:hypothetical protein
MKVVPVGVVSVPVCGRALAFGCAGTLGCVVIDIRVSWVS